MGETAIQDSGAENSIDAAAPGTIPPKKGVARVFTVEMLLATIAGPLGRNASLDGARPLPQHPHHDYRRRMFTLSIVLVIRLSMDRIRCAHANLTPCCAWRAKRSKACKTV